MESSDITKWPVMVRTQYPKTQTPITIAVLSDSHFTKKEHGTWKMLHKTEDMVERAIDDIKQNNTGDFDLVVYAGDLTYSGKKSEYNSFDKIISKIEVPSVAIPGNHDIDNGLNSDQSLTKEQFAKRYDVDSYPFHRTVGGVSIIGLDTASSRIGEPPEDWGGIISNDQIEWLEKELPTIQNPVVFMHHNLNKLPENPDEFPWNQFPIKNNEKVKDIFTQNNVPLVISAHHHLPAINTIQNPKGDSNKLVEVMCPAICSFPQAYITIRIDAKGTVVRYIPLADREEILSAWHAAKTDLTRSRGIAELAQRRLKSLFTQ